MLFRNEKKDNREGSNSDIVPMLPLRELIVFPHGVYPIFVGRQKSIKALESQPTTIAAWTPMDAAACVNVGPVPTVAGGTQRDQ